jgi:signal transduction histidine kinase/CheY-like chemotaxis protein
MWKKVVMSSVADDEAQRRSALEQVHALFGAVTVGVCGAAIGAIILTAVLYHLGFNGQAAFAWAVYMSLCALGHILLRGFYRRSRAVGDQWRAWALWFTLISFCEGIGLGWAPLGLTTGGRLDVELLVLLVTLSIAAGAIPVFGSYLPAFLACFVPATFPYEVASILSHDPVKRAAGVLVLVFIGGMGSVGIMTNRRFKQLIGLRIQTEKLAADLQRQKEIAERASLAKSTFLAAASHDLRQPVHALGLFVGALRGVAMAPEGRRLIEQIDLSVTAMDGLFTALLDISRLDAGVVAVQPRPFAIRSLLDRISRDHAEEARAKGVSLVWKDSTAIVETDPVLMERILRNLVSNAARYTDRGRIVIGCRRRGVMALVQVWDTGRGIPRDQQERVFQEYYQLGNPERDRTKGLGLGLAIVRRLTDLLECKLTLRSELGRGSCFEVAIPLAGNALAPSEPALEGLSGALAHGLIVVIDDESAIRDAMSTLLAGWGHDVIAVGSGDEAMQRLSTCPTRPALVICDYRLRGDENGIGIIERLRSEYNDNIPAMLITGDTAPGCLAEAKQTDLLLLHKPVPNGKLRAAIANLIATGEDDAAVSWDHRSSNEVGFPSGGRRLGAVDHIQDLEDR